MTYTFILDTETFSIDVSPTISFINQDLESDGFNLKSTNQGYKLNKNQCIPLILYFQMVSQRFSCTVTCSHKHFQTLIQTEIKKRHLPAQLKIFRSFNPSNEAHSVKVGIPQEIIRQMNSRIKTADQLRNFFQEAYYLGLPHQIIFSDGLLFIQWFMRLHCIDIIGRHFLNYKSLLEKHSYDDLLQSNETLFWDALYSNFKSQPLNSISIYRIKQDTHFNHNVLKPLYSFFPSINKTLAYDEKLFSGISIKQPRKSLFSTQSLQLLVNRNFREPQAGIPLNQLLFIQEKSGKIYCVPNLSSNHWTEIHTTHQVFIPHQTTFTDFINSQSLQSLKQSNKVDEKIHQQIHNFIHVNHMYFLFRERHQLYVEDLHLRSSKFKRETLLNKEIPAIVFQSKNELEHAIPQLIKEFQYISEFIFTSDVLMDFLPCDDITLKFSFDATRDKIKSQINYSLGKEKLEFKDLFQFFQSKEKLIEIRPGKFIRNSVGFKQKIQLHQQLAEFSSDHTENHFSLPFYNYAYILHLQKHFPELVQTTEKFVQFISNINDFSSTEPLTPSKQFKGQLRPYQQFGIQWFQFLTANKFSGILADDMGLGKTIQIIAFLSTRLREKTLIVCPATLMENWLHEFKKFAPEINTQIIHGASIVEITTSVTITSYHTLIKRKELIDYKWGHLVLDEAQHIKNPKTKIAETCRKISAKFKVCLSGTPIENQLGDLWSLFEFLMPGFLGSKAHFDKRYVLEVKSFAEDGFQAEAEARYQELKQRISPFVLQRKKSDPTVISDLPEKIEKVEYAELSKDQKRLYKKLTDKFEENDLLPKTIIETQQIILTLLTRLKQVCNHPCFIDKNDHRLKGRSGKLSLLETLLNRIQSVNEKTLLFSQYQETCQLLKTYLSHELGYQVLLIDGSVAIPERQKIVNRFQSEETPFILILSLKAGGTGLNLTEANHVIHYDRWWNPAVENQATDRAYRIGQKKNVMVHKLVSAGTLEEKIDRLLETKKQLADSIISDDSSLLKSLSKEELIQLFKADF